MEDAMLKKYLTALLIGATAFSFSLSSTEEQRYFEPYEMAFIKTEWQIDHDLFTLHVIPKCGTHFIQHTLHLMTGQASINQDISLQNLTKACNTNKILRTFQPYDDKLCKALKKYQHKLISVIRDPRDALISHLFYMRSFAERKVENNQRRDFFVVDKNFDSLSLQEQLDSLIYGTKEGMSYLDFYKSRIGWALNSASLVIKYEELLGKEGGGNNKKQKKTIDKVASFIQLDLSSEQQQYVLANMYKETGEQQVEEGKVFTRATKGNWRTFLSEKQKRSIKKKLGKEMILLGYEKDLNW